MRPSCGSRFSEMSSEARILIWFTSGMYCARSDDVTLGELAVDAHTDAAALFVGFEVDVAGVVAQRLAHQREEELPPLSDPRPCGLRAALAVCAPGPVMLQQKPLQVTAAIGRLRTCQPVEHSNSPAPAV